MDISKYERKIRFVRRLDRSVSGIVLLVLAAATSFMIWGLCDEAGVTRAGIETVQYHDFTDLAEINPDIVCWLRLEGTNIDHPVVQGEDNFEYLDRDFYGNDYAGGSLFLDEHCSPDLTGNYLIIHGHHMAHGAMFGDLEKYWDEDFFSSERKGELLTVDSIYELTVIGVAEVDAYDADVYYTDDSRPLPLELLSRCTRAREAEFGEGDRLILLSTCSGDMTSSRTAVFCLARFMGENDI